MEYLDGPTLKELLVRKGPTPAADRDQVRARDPERARRGAPPRDRPPRHQAAQRDREHATDVKVTDFGIARSGASQMTEAGSIVGTAQYLSPEQARGKPVDQRSDLYSLGIVLYEMLTGTVPFTGDAPVEIAMKHLSSVPEPPSTLRPEVPHDLDAVVMRALAKDSRPALRLGRGDGRRPGARRARRVGVAQTEEAMTQVLAGRASPAPDVVPPRRGHAPARAAGLPPAGYYDYEEPPRRRSIWPDDRLGLILAGAAGGYLLYTKVQHQLNKNKPVAVPDVSRWRGRTRCRSSSRQGCNPVTITASSDTVAKAS